MSEVVPLKPVRASDTGIWRIAADESALQLVVADAVVCEVHPWTHNETGALVYWAAKGTDRQETEIGLELHLAPLCRKVAAHFRVDAPITSALLAELREPADAADASETPVALGESLLKRLADLVAAILDEPLITLPGRDPGGSTEPLQLRLAHYRPDLSERAAILLEEAGR